MLWTTIAILVGLSLLLLQLQIVWERRWEMSGWLSGSLVVWGLNAWFALYIFQGFWQMAFAVGKTALVGSAFLNVILLGLALGARRLAHDEEPTAFGPIQIVASALAGLSLVAGLWAIVLLWAVVFS